MFTGIIECLGSVGASRVVSEGNELSVLAAEDITKKLRIGDSVSINGACQTVVSFFAGGFTVQVARETLDKTSLGSLKPGEYLNLETALTLSTPLGGHLVLGHVDGTGTVRDISTEGFAKRFYINCGKEIQKYIVPKGSITVDGISLTIASVETFGFSVSIIPHTLVGTVLEYRRPGDVVNIEGDIIGKYVINFLNTEKNSEKNSDTLSLELLKKAGFSRP